VPITMADLSIVGIPSPAAAPYFGWDLVRDVQELFRYAFMQHAFEAGTVVALTAGVIGYFVVLRGLSFAAHGLSHIGFAGATGAVLLGLAPIVGLLAFTMSAGAVMGALGQRLRGRDVTIGRGRSVSACFSRPSTRDPRPGRSAFCSVRSSGSRDRRSP